MSLAEILRASASTRMARGSLSDDPGHERLNANGSSLDIVRLSSEPGEHGTAPIEFDRSDVFVFVHHGHLALEVDGETYELGPGDTLHGDRPHSISWRVTGERIATTIWAAAARHTAR
jgi:mannose-6-phosphate isomerase-like protein (cupin superfamily)